MTLIPIEEKSSPFVFECMKELRGEANYNYTEFYDYIKRNFLDKKQDTHFILIAYDNKKPIGLLTCNKFLMPRYLGFGYELEEVVVDKNYRNRGYGVKMIELFLQDIQKQSNYKELRKVIVKTNDPAIPPKLYQKFFLKSNSVTYLKQINHL